MTDRHEDCGTGLVVAAALGTVAAAAPPENRAEALAGVFLAAYLGITAPVVVLGVAIRHVPLVWALTAYAGAAALGAVLAGWGVLRAARVASAR